MPETIFDVVGLACIEAVPPHRPGALLIFRVEHAVPCFTVGRARRHASEFVPAVVIIIVETIGPRRPNHLVDRVGDRFEALLALAQRGFGPLPIGDIRAFDEDASHFTDRDR